MITNRLTGVDTLGVYAALRARAYRFDRIGQTTADPEIAARAHQAAHAARITAAAYCPRADVKEQLDGPVRNDPQGFGWLIAEEYAR